MALVVDLHLRYGYQVLELNVTAELLFVQRLALNTQKPTYLLSAGIKGMSHHILESLPSNSDRSKRFLNCNMGLPSGHLKQDVSSSSGWLAIIDSPNEYSCASEPG